MPPVSDEAKQEVKRAYFELNSRPEFMDKIGLLFDGADTTMVKIDKSNQTWSLKLDPECFSDWFRLTRRVHSWVTRFVNNCRVNREHRLSGELTIEEIRDSEKIFIIKVAFKEELVKSCHELGRHNAGTNQTLSALSTKYWIIAARELEWEKECAVCLRKRAKQVMAPLPLCRLQSS